MAGSVERDCNHPCIVCWCPWNETWDRNQVNTNISEVYFATKAVDPTAARRRLERGFHIVTDIYDVHDYEQDPEIFYARYKKHCEGDYFVPFAGRTDRLRPGAHRIWSANTAASVGQSGKKQNEENDTKVSWGYGNAPATPEEFCDRYCRLTRMLLKSFHLRILLHATDRRRAGTERPVLLRPPRKIFRRAVCEDACGHTPKSRDRKINIRKKPQYIRRRKSIKIYVAFFCPAEKSENCYGEKIHTFPGACADLPSNQTDMRLSFFSQSFPQEA